ncbi:chromosome condensation complex Condensin, subunit G [Didymosphaeria variabile]|uniref:Chromosome condensation complex Condensin, subunit G n=1 Tax=Didymosphaeria variabile TaxID=1932322 RepID=A0A9W8XCB8_9PLEO|nr:chromosome condensation complex Condensin, subunit G [Didymosphaeria variabile]KAJ4346878.1 chromosome condensation complex Condensin, subunit G [Didymosphaeria variabile]
MPGRTSTRSTRSARSSTATTTTRKSAGRGRSSAANVEIPDEGPETSIRTEIVQIFNDAQNTTATQRKLQTMLRKVQERCSFEQPESKKKKAQQEEQFDEQDFNNEVVRCVLRILNVKKGIQEGDRVIKFLGMFLKNASEKGKFTVDRQIFQPDGDDVTETPETPTSRLIEQIIRTLSGILFPGDGNPVQNKIVHFRATQALAHIVGQLPALDVDLYGLLRVYFKKLSRHKETSVRVQAVLGLSHFVKTDEDEDDEEDDEDDEDIASNIMEKLLDMMQNDPSAEVRRAILHNIEPNKETMRYVFERARDMDPMVRRIVYRKVLPSLADFRYMRLVEREKLIRWGLRDRDDLVRKAAARVFAEKWLEDCARTYDIRPEEEKKPGEPAPPSLEAVRELLERINVVDYGDDEGIAHDAMQQFWEIRTDYRDFVTFDHNFWKQKLDPQYAFLARSLMDYCNSLNEITDIRLKQDLEDKFPDTPHFANIVLEHLNALFKSIQLFYDSELPEDDSEVIKLQEDTSDKEFTVQQLLHIALSLDYSDPVGRNQMMNMVRQALSRPDLPDGCTKVSIQVLRVCCDTEADFCQLIVEAIAEVKDTLMADDAIVTGDDVDDDESFHSAQSDVESDTGEARPKKAKAVKELNPEEEERQRNTEINVYLKCLDIAQCMLQTVVESDFSDQSLATILNTLIIPAVRGQEAMIRERGLLCLALGSILSEDLARNNIELFLHCFAKGHDALKEIVIQGLVDIVWQHKSLLKAEPAEEGDEPKPSELVKKLTKSVLLKGLKSDNNNICLIACTAAAKLLLFDLLPREETAHILKDLTLAYFNPETAQQPGVRQALSYFLPTFCHSKLTNALLMAQISVQIIGKLCQMKEDMDEDDDDMVGWPVITAHLADWTDGRKVVNQTQMGLDGKSSTNLEAEEPHIWLATETLEYALTRNCSRDERKPVLTLLTKACIAPTGPAPNEEKLSTLLCLVNEAVESKLGTDATQRNYLTKLEVNLTKRMGDVETVTQAAESGAATVTPEATEIPETAPAEEGAEEEEDTMMAGMQGESTRMPLDLEEDDEVDMDDVANPITEDDIVNSLLASELDEDGDEDDTIVAPARISRH